MKYTLELLYGLPGSGKSYYAKKEAEENDETRYVEADKAPMYTVRTELFKSYVNKRVIVDRLLLTTKQVMDFLEGLGNFGGVFNKVKIVYFRENRDICLHNDEGRRTENSIDTILHATFEYPDIEALKEKFKGIEFEIEERDIVLNPLWIRRADTARINTFGDYLYSEPWVVGGTSRSYDENYDSVYHSIEGEDMRNFDELENWISECYPSINFVQYLYIMKHFVEKEEYEESDYYSDLTKCKYKANLKEIYQYLQREESEGSEDAEKISCVATFDFVVEEGETKEMIKRKISNMLTDMGMTNNAVAFWD